MKKQDEYIAKETFTFPLICLVCLTFYVYWGCADGWPAGAIIGTSFFGIITICYVGKYISFGRNYLKIDANGIEIKDWRKITVLKWSGIKKCAVFYKSSYASTVLFERDLFIVAKSDNKREQHFLSAFRENTVATRASLRRLSVSAAMMFLTVNHPALKIGIWPEFYWQFLSALFGLCSKC